MSTTYNYNEAIKNDIREYINDNYTSEEIKERLCDRDEWEEELNDELWITDSVTGNASGSYTFNRWTAEENLCHNLDLLGEVLQEFGIGPEYLIEKGAEAADVTIRCYLLGGAINDILDELENKAEEV
jgi:hypothetical protein